MKKRSETTILILLVTYSTIFFATTALVTRLAVAIYFSITRGGFFFSETNLISSIKIGVAAGIPLGIGLWVLDKLDK